MTAYCAQGDRCPTGKPGLNIRPFLAAALAFFLAACSTAPYRYESVESFDFRQSSKSKTIDNVTVSSSVMSEAQAEELFGFPMHEREIQPVWIEVVNSTDDYVWFAPTSVDPDYFSPVEVAYIFRKGHSKEAQIEMQKRMHRLAMPRQIPAGETRSGFVFTNARPGTKSFNVDLFLPADDPRRFSFFLTAPGFVADHAGVDFYHLFDESDILRVSKQEFETSLAEMPFHATNQAGDTEGLPASIWLVGSGELLLRALLRAGWNETAINAESIEPELGQYLFGRLPDAVFRHDREGNRDRNELRIWLTPLMVDDQPVWAAQVTQFIGQSTQLQQLIFGAVFDPDLDNGRNYLMQILWYNQAMKQTAWQKVEAPSSLDEPKQDFTDTNYFTDGYRAVVWLAEKAIPLNEVTELGWDDRRSE